MCSQEKLSDIISQKIRAGGPISFRDFMEDALYYPGLGYYTSDRENIGKAGDYYTSPYATSLLGEMLARQILQFWNLMDRKSMLIVEFGGGNGTLTNHILDEIEKTDVHCQNIRYAIVEKANYGSVDHDSHSNKIKWVSHISEIGPFEGCVISNELIDNLPFHRLVMADRLMELYVGYEEEKGFMELTLPADTDLTEYFDELNIALPAGYQTEVCTDAIQWIHSVSTYMTKGFLVTIDYGFTSQELYSDKRSSGNMLCYRNQQVSTAPYQFIGQQDITTHINFSALDHWGNKFGLSRSGYTNQSAFLRSLGLAEHLRTLERQGLEKNGSDQQQKIDFLFRFLILMSEKFRILIQQKNMPRCNLTGLQFSMPFY